MGSAVGFEVWDGKRSQCLTRDKACAILFATDEPLSLSQARPDDDEALERLELRSDWECCFAFSAGLLLSAHVYACVCVAAVDGWPEVIFG